MDLDYEGNLLNKARSGERKTVQKRAADYRLNIREKKKRTTNFFVYSKRAAREKGTE
jgi:hypothetical protein